MQSRHINYADVHVEMFMLLAMRPVGDRLRRAFEMNRETVAANACVERLVVEVQVESELLAVIRDCGVKVVHQKLRCDPGKLCGTGHGRDRHVICPPHDRHNAALERLAHATTNKGYSPASPLQALVRRAAEKKNYLEYLP